MGKMQVGCASNCWYCGLKWLRTNRHTKKHSARQPQTLANERQLDVAWQWAVLQILWSNLFVSVFILIHIRYRFADCVHTYVLIHRAHRVHTCVSCFLNLLCVNCIYVPFSFAFRIFINSSFAWIHKRFIYSIHPQVRCLQTYFTLILYAWRSVKKFSSFLFAVFVNVLLIAIYWPTVNPPNNGEQTTSTPPVLKVPVCVLNNPQFVKENLGIVPF